jgi:hypothetical protein
MTAHIMLKAGAPAGVGRPRKRRTARRGATARNCLHEGLRRMVGAARNTNTEKRRDE